MGSGSGAFIDALEHEQIGIDLVQMVTDTILPDVFLFSLRSNNSTMQTLQ